MLSYFFVGGLVYCEQKNYFFIQSIELFKSNNLYLLVFNTHLT
ncbi:hypothetical protein J2W55_004777 [Mucilaginibacter pocheonensis]|uniref:Uncharacterized protein n=1 Tax=Mucilaginibacter pocheonensis TaxID=398050 RepID=A0ABU1THX1_9SPHI|nr:hypothetical protein [Mucilaginibacter pocheonensis]